MNPRDGFLLVEGPAGAALLPVGQVRRVTCDPVFALPAARAGFCGLVRIPEGWAPVAANARLAWGGGGGALHAVVDLEGHLLALPADRLRPAGPEDAGQPVDLNELYKDISLI